MFIVLFVLISFIDLTIWKYLTNGSAAPNTHTQHTLHTAYYNALLSLTTSFVERWNLTIGYLSKWTADAKHKNVLHNQNKAKRKYAVDMYLLCQFFVCRLAITMKQQILETHRNCHTAERFYWYEMYGLFKHLHMFSRKPLDTFAVWFAYILYIFCVNERL